MKVSLIRVALALGASTLALTPALATNSWGGYHWARTSNPVGLTVNTAITTDWGDAVTASVFDWNSAYGGSSVSTLGTLPTGTSTVLLLKQQAKSGVSPKQCSPITGQILVCNASYSQRGWLGVANIWLSGLHITKATTKLNDTYFNMAQYNTPKWRALVVCQEIGHDFGLDHQDTTFANTNLGTCMDYTNAPGGGGTYGPSNVYPNQHDYDELGIIYSHLDTTNTAISSASTNFGIRSVGQAVVSSGSAESSGNSPAEWGRAIRFDAQGRPDVFVKLLAGGGKMLTHVFWAIGEQPR